MTRVKPIVCYVTDRRLFGEDWPRALLASVSEAARAGVHLIQVRERDLETRDLRWLVRACVGATRSTSARVVVNDRLDVAIAAGAHGVHLPAAGAPPTRVRAIAPRAFLIGRSVHEQHDAVAVVDEGAVDYLIFGTVFSTSSKPQLPAVGADALRAVSQAVAVPVLAIGGVTLDQLPTVASTGAAGFAAIQLFAKGQSDAVDFRRIVHESEGAFTRAKRAP